MHHVKFLQCAFYLANAFFFPWVLFMSTPLTSVPLQKALKHLLWSRNGPRVAVNTPVLHGLGIYVFTTRTGGNRLMRVADWRPKWFNRLQWAIQVFDKVSENC